MYKEILYFGAELLNYWAMTFWGLKLFAKVYDIEINKNKILENVIFALLCLPISVVAAGNSTITLYSNIVNYSMIIYLFMVLYIIRKKVSRPSISLIAVYIFGIRLIELLIVSVAVEISNISRVVIIDLIHIGIDRVIFIVLLALGYYIIYKICYKSQIIDYLKRNKIYCILLCIYGYLGTSCFGTVYRFDYREQLLKYWIFYLVCAFICVGAILFYLVKVKGQEREKFLNMRNDLMEANYQGLQKAYDANRVLQHDNKNHMLAMYELIKENKNEEALNYINLWMEVSQQPLGDIKSGNAILDIIVNSKVNEAKDKQIDFQYDIEHLGDINIEDVDLCALLANLLDNSIEASEKVTGNPWIHLKIHRKNDTMLILIKNSIPKKMLEKKKFFETQKENPHLHGWGMKSIEHVVHKYDGEIEHTWKEESFETFVTIPL